MRTCITVVLACLLLQVSRVEAGDKRSFYVRVQNDLVRTCHFFWRSNANTRGFYSWRVEINRKQTSLVQFTGDDPFAFVIRVGEVERYLATRNLREYAEGNPYATLLLRGGYLSRVVCVYNPRTRRHENRTVRDYVVWADFLLPDGTVQRLNTQGR